MKKYGILLFLVVLLISLCACSLGGKNLFKPKSDQQIANERLDAFLQALENKDNKTLKSLFSAKAVSESDSFENDLQSMLDYFEGVTASYNNQSPISVEKERDEDFEKKTIFSTYDIQTDKQTYRIAIQDVIYNTYDEDDVGIHSLYIIIMSDDTDPNYAYRGDGKNTPGINIGIKNITP